MSIIKGWEKVKDGVDLLHPVGDDVTGKGDDPHGRSKESKALGRGPWNPTVERVHFQWSLLPAPDDRFGGVEAEPHRRPEGLEQVEGAT